MSQVGTEKGNGLYQTGVTGFMVLAKIALETMITNEPWNFYVLCSCRFQIICGGSDTALFLIAF